MKLSQLFCTIALVLFIGCSGGSEKNQSGQSATSNGERTIEIIGLNSMKFAVAEDAEGISVGEPDAQEQDLLILESITAKPGETITIELTTRSTMPPAAMAHNWILLEKGVDAEAFVNASIRAKDNEYIAPELEDQTIAYTDLASGGETVEVTFTAPSEPGEYEYLCSFPGHYVGGMRGTLIVEEQ